MVAQPRGEGAAGGISGWAGAGGGSGLPGGCAVVCGGEGPYADGLRASCPGCGCGEEEAAPGGCAPLAVFLEDEVPFRFDIVEVVLQDGSVPEISRVEGAFEMRQEGG